MFWSIKYIYEHMKKIKFYISQNRWKDSIPLPPTPINTLLTTTIVRGIFNEL